MSFLEDVILKEFLETVTRHWDPYLTSFPLHALSTLSHVIGGPILPISPETCDKIPVQQPSDPPPAYSTSQSMLHPIVTVSSSQDSWLLCLFPGTPRPLPLPWRSLCSVREESSQGKAEAGLWNAAVWPECKLESLCTEASSLQLCNTTCCRRTGSVRKSTEWSASGCSSNSCLLRLYFLWVCFLMTA